MKIAYGSITHKGQRSNNEDSIAASPSSGLFIVCDGVGGSSKGEVASKLACETMEKYFSENITTDITAGDIDLAVKATEEAFNQYVSANPGSEGMGTTLTLLYLTGRQAMIAHIGDSRVYQVRNGNIVFRTRDHSLVDELVAGGFITEDEARTHPQRNVITRALQGQKHPVKADTHFSAIVPGDYFMLCTDGILESIDDMYIRETFKAGNNVNAILAAIETVCNKYSTDNFSAIVVQAIKEAGDIEAYPAVDDMSNDQEQAIQPGPAAYDPNETNSVKKTQKKWFLVIMLVIAATFAWLFFQWKSKQPAHKATGTKMHDSR